MERKIFVIESILGAETEIYILRNGFTNQDLSICNGIDELRDALHKTPSPEMPAPNIGR